jgi:hypothetical protein
MIANMSQRQEPDKENKAKTNIAFPDNLSLRKKGQDRKQEKFNPQTS